MIHGYHEPSVCPIFTVGSWLGGCLLGSILTFLVFKSPYCGPNEADNFFCDIPVVLPLACVDTSLAQMVSFTNVDFVTLTMGWDCQEKLKGPLDSLELKDVLKSDVD